MPRQSFKVNVNPKILQWAIDSAGWERDELLKSLGISDKIYEAWLNCSVNPTIRQIEDISKKTKRPLASFFLPEPPKEEPKPKDYRMLPDRKDKFERKTIFAIRKARYLQEISNELSLNLNENLTLKLKKATLNDNPQRIAEEYREKFNLSIEKQKEFKTPYEFYAYLRVILEKFNIFSFQISMPLDDARGFALADQIPRVIVVNSGDDIKPRIFTLMHEFAHILLGETSIDLPNLNSQDIMEKWCNKLAANFLMPKDMLTHVYNENKKCLADSKILDRISNKYKISKSMFLYNLTETGHISKQQYSDFLNAIPKKEDKKTSKGGGGVSQDKKCISILGKKFVSLVADNIEKQQITTNDALSYLSIKSKNLDKVLSQAGK